MAIQSHPHAQTGQGTLCFLSHLLSRRPPTKHIVILNSCCCDDETSCFPGGFLPCSTVLTCKGGSFAQQAGRFIESRSHQLYIT